MASGDFERFFGTAVPLLLEVGLALSVGPVLGLAGVFVGGFLASASLCSPFGFSGPIARDQT